MPFVIKACELVPIATASEYVDMSEGMSTSVSMQVAMLLLTMACMHCNQQALSASVTMQAQLKVHVFGISAEVSVSGVQSLSYAYRIWPMQRKTFATYTPLSAFTEQTH